MKLTTIILLTACLGATAHGYAQKISISVKDVTLDKVFNEIKRQTSYTFFYTDDQLRKAKKVTLEINNATIEEVLNQCFQTQPFTFSIINTMVVVKPRIGELQAPEVGPPPIDIHARVVNEKGDPVEGVTVTVQGTKKATSTDSKGEFQIISINDNATIVFTGSNVETREVSLSNNPGLKVGAGELFIVTLKSKVSALDEVQIIAYGTTTKRLSTGNISTVKGEDIAKQPVNNPLLALEGRVPGLFLSQATGLPGSAVTVRIQGQNSIGNGNEPFYVIDGVPYTSQLLSTSPYNLGSILGSASGSSSNGNPLSYINPADIESIDVLKDADATAIYGSRAANGAILITTKKGKAGKTKGDINLQNGWGKITRKFDLLNTQQYLQMRHEAIKNDGSTTGITDYDINGLWDTARYTNWQKTLIGGTAQYININGSVSGGTVNTQYFIGCTFHRETTVFPGSFRDQKGSLHFNINNISLNYKFKLQLSGSYLVDDNLLPYADFTSVAITLPPDAPALYNSDGSLNWMPNGAGSSTWTNPLSNNLVTYHNKANNLTSNAIVTYELFPGLEIKSSFGYTNLQTNETVVYPILRNAPEIRPSSFRAALYSPNSNSSWIIEPQAKYFVRIGKGKLEALIGSTIQKNMNTGQVLFGSGYNSDLVLNDPKSASSIRIDATIATVYKYNAIFSRLNYDYQGKYIFDFTIRKDGSSRFGSENQLHNFWATAVGWIFSNEKLFQNNFPFISFGKFKGSYGTTGNDQIGDYKYLNLYSPTSVGIAYQGAPGLSSTGLPNPYLQWEETKKISVGLDLGLLKNRVLLNVTYAQNRSSNQLLSYALPIITGFNGIAKNFPATIQNSSWELALNTSNIKTKNFRWSSSINLTIPENKLIAFPNLSTSTYSSQLVIGQPIIPYLLKVYHFLGADPATGRYQFADSHGNPTFTPNPSTDKTVNINLTPMFYGGFENSFDYGGFHLDVLFQFVKQIGANYFFGNAPGSPNRNQPVSVLQRWQKLGDITSIQRYNSNFSLNGSAINARLASDAGFSDDSYIRLKNISLSWEFPERLREKMRLQNARVYIQGQNLFTITKYKGMDPENGSVSTGSQLPPLRILTLGIQVGL